MFDRTQPWLPFVGAQITVDRLVITVTGGYVDVCGVLLLEGDGPDGEFVDNVPLTIISLPADASDAQRAVFAQQAEGFD